MFLSPLYLLLLVPWAAMVLWLLTGQRNQVGVPFLELWGGPVVGPKIKRTIQSPPMALACVIIAMLLAILAASGPKLREAGGMIPLTIIVDRGITMSASDGGESRRDRVIDEAASIVSKSSQAIRLIEVPGSAVNSTGSEWAGRAESTSFSAIDTHQLLPIAIADTFREGDGRIVVLSDQRLNRDDARLIQISPQTTPQNLSIVRIAASSTPHPQAMLRLRNQSPATEANITIRSGTVQTARLVQLKPNGTEQDLFFDLPAFADTIEADVNASDDLSIDNHAYLVRQRAWPNLEPQSALSPELRRMIDVYQKHRPSSDESVHVAIGSNQLFSNHPMIDVIDDTTKLQPIANAKIQSTAHPIVAGIDCSGLANDGMAGVQIGDGWNPIVTAGSLVLVAVRDQPARQVRVSFSSARIAESPDFVLFWTNVFDWVGGGGGDEFVGEAVKSLGSEWKLESPAPDGNFGPAPGIYRRDDGARRALNAIDVKFGAPHANDWHGKFDQVAKRQAVANPLQNQIAVFSLVALLLAALHWKRHRIYNPNPSNPLPNRV